MRGQAEAVGAIVIAMLILAGLLVHGLAIRSASKQMQESSELAQLEVARRAEELYFYSNATGIYARSTTGSTVVYVAVYNDAGVVYEGLSPVYVPLNWTLLVANATIARLVKDGGAHLVVVTDRGNVFTWDPYGETAQLGDLLNVAYWVFERVSPTYVPSASAVYRARRVIAPYTYVYVFSVGNSAVALGAWEVLRTFPVYVNTQPPNLEGSYIYAEASGSPQGSLDLDDSTYGFAGRKEGDLERLYICVNFNTTVTGWFFVYVRMNALAPGMHVSVRASNYTCAGGATRNVATVSCTGWCDVRVAGYMPLRSLRVEVPAQSVRVYVHSIEFYFTWTDRLVYEGNTPASELVTIFADSGTHVQVIEVTKLRLPGGS